MISVFLFVVFAKVIAKFLKNKEIVCFLSKKYLLVMKEWYKTVLIVLELLHFITISINV